MAPTAALHRGRTQLSHRWGMFLVLAGVIPLALAGVNAVPSSSRYGREALISGTEPSFLTVDKTKNSLAYEGRPVYLSGVNQAWLAYGNDFGNGRGPAQLPGLVKYLQDVHNAGGNSVRIWLHVSGENTPSFNATGHVVGPDSTGTLVDDMRAYLKVARSLNIFVFFCLWNGAAMLPAVSGLIYDEGKLQSYIDTVLSPMVKALANEPSLGGWEVMNEPEGSVQMGVKDSNPCFASDAVQSGGGWSKANLPYRLLLRFINWQADAIHAADPKTLVTTGTWSMGELTSSYGLINHYTDECLVAAGGRAGGVLDFFEVHTYAWKGAYQAYEPFLHNAADYALSKPLLVGEFSAKTGAGRTPEQMYTFAHDNNYAGSFGWQALRTDTSDTSDGMDALGRGMQSVRHHPDVAVDLSTEGSLV